jgi:hypothetical protein
MHGAPHAVISQLITQGVPLSDDVLTAAKEMKNERLERLLSLILDRSAGPDQRSFLAVLSCLEPASVWSVRDYDA